MQPRTDLRLAASLAADQRRIADRDRLLASLSKPDRSGSAATASSSRRSLVKRLIHARRSHAVLG
jgi:hypothetical protein